ncbi:MAG TPA: hybrid sensor histidine kinase/response regulator [Myxococcota bacterium]
MTMTIHAPLSLPKVLVVDDLEENLLAMRALLESDEVEILTAKSGEEALELLLVHDVGLALLDVQMPGMDGFELAELMRGPERTRRVPIIFITAGSRDHKRVFQGYETGAVDYLLKPVEPHVLRSKVAIFVELYQQRRELDVQIVRLNEAKEERERLLSELRTTLSLNELFVGVVGHDLRGPINAIMTSTNILEQISEEPDVQEVAGRLRSIGQRMTRMIGDLLDLTRSRLGGGIPIALTKTDLAQLAANIVDETRLAHPNRVIEVEQHGNLEIDADGDRLVQAMANLLANAAAHGADGVVQVVLDGRKSDEVSFFIENDGTVPADDLPRLFDPFKGSKGKTPGLGLGLFIVDQIVKAHRGGVVATSANGRTRFTVTVPRRHEGGVVSLPIEVKHRQIRSASSSTSSSEDSKHNPSWRL